jgi:hypothetical protein
MISAQRRWNCEIGWVAKPASLGTMASGTFYRDVRSGPDGYRIITGVVERSMTTDEPPS